MMSDVRGMRSFSARRRQGIVSMLALVGFSSIRGTLSAQSPLKVAEERSVVLPVRAAQFSLNVSDEEFGVHLLRDQNKGVPDKVEMCSLGNRGAFAKIPNHNESRLDFGLAAKDGKRGIVSSGQLSPAFDVSLTLSKFLELGWIEPTTDICERAQQKLKKDSAAPVELDLKSSGYNALFLTVTASVVERKLSIASAPVGGESTVSLDKTAGGHLAVVGGWNRAFTESRVLGIAVDVGREWATPGENDPVSVCTVSSSGTDSEGKRVRTESCEDRFEGRLPDVWRSQLRAAWTQKLWMYGGGKGPSLGLISALTVTGRTELKPAYAASAGLTLHPANKPNHVVGAALLEFDDLTNSGGKHPTVLKMLSIKLVLGVPLN